MCASQLFIQIRHCEESWIALHLKSTSLNSNSNLFPWIYAIRMLLWTLKKSTNIENPLLWCWVIKIPPVPARPFPFFLLHPAHHSSFSLFYIFSSKSTKQGSCALKLKNCKFWITLFSHWLKRRSLDFYRINHILTSLKHSLKLRTG